MRRIAIGLALSLVMVTMVPVQAAAHYDEDCWSGEEAVDEVCHQLNHVGVAVGNLPGEVYDCIQEACYEDDVDQLVGFVNALVKYIHDYVVYFCGDEDDWQDGSCGGGLFIGDLLPDGDPSDWIDGLVVDPPG